MSTDKDSNHNSIDLQFSYFIHTSIDPPSQPEIFALSNFLHEHLGEYGDPKHHIQAAIEYAVGGNILDHVHVLLNNQYRKAGVRVNLF